MIDDFYRYIYKNGEGYQIIKNNVDYGTYTNVRDALFDRDLLEQLDWDYEALLNYNVDVPNHYMHMKLPPFSHKSRYIQFVPAEYRVYIQGELFASFKYKNDALDYIERCGDGELRVKPEKFLLYKFIDGKKVHFGTFYDYMECINRRDELIEKDWKK